MLTLVLCVLTVISCVRAGGASEPTAEVSVTLDRRAYAPGDTARVVIERTTAGEIAYCFYCDAFVEARCDTAWTTIYEPDCTNVRIRPTRLSKGESVVESLVIVPPREKCGPYRLRLRYQENDDAGYRAVYSPEFEITTR
jgi:hypothetical protein